MRENVETQSIPGGVNLQELLLQYLRKWWLIALCCILSAAIAYGYTRMFVTPTYTANISLYINNSSNKQSSDYVSSSDLSASSQLVDGYRSIVTSHRVLEAVSKELDHDYTAGQLAGYIATGKEGGTQIFRVYVTHAIPTEAARIANAMAEVFPAKGAEIIEGSSARVIDHAKVPVLPVSPNYMSQAIKGGFVGALLAVVFLTIQHLGDTRIKDEDELLAMFGLPVLGRIPDFEQERATSAYEYVRKRATEEGTQ